MKKLLIVNSVCGTGSTGKICEGIADEYSDNGWDVRIAYGRNGSGEELNRAEEEYGYRIGTDLDVKVHGMITRMYDLHGFGSKDATKRFLEWADEFNPDILWLHNIHGYYVNIEELFLWIKKRQKAERRDGRKVMEVRWTLHDCWAFTGHCAYFTYAGCEKWKSGCQHCPQKRSYPESFGLDNSRQNYQIKRRLFNGVENLKIITPSHWLAELVKESFLKEYPVEVVANKIDTTVFKPTSSNFRKDYGLEDRFIILGVANIWDERKGHRDFIALAERLDSSFAIVLVGLSKKQVKMFQELNRRVSAEIMALERTGSVNELVELYSAADVFFNPTYEDNLPTVNLEAKACGCKIITYDTGGAAEAAGEDACVIETGDINSVLQKLHKLKGTDKEASNFNVPARILYVNGGLMNKGGIPEVMMNYYRHMDRKKVQVDFIVHGDGVGENDAEIEQMGGQIFHVPIKGQSGMKRYMDALETVMRSYPYQIIHSHMDEMNYPVLLKAKEVGIPVRISHCHTMGMGMKFGLRSLPYEYARLMLPSVATNLWSCSNDAGRRLYGRHRFRVIPNAIEVERFLFNKDARERIRAELGIDHDTVVIGQVGHIYFVKNQLFFERVFAEVVKRCAGKVKWLVIGSGEDEEKLKEQIKTDGIEDDVIMTGRIDDVSEYYNAMDIFVMPSISEGFPVSAVEAQVNGLPCLFSEAITRDVKCFQNKESVDFLSLEVQTWVDYLINRYDISAYNRSEKRKKNLCVYKTMDIEHIARQLQRAYERLSKSISR